MNLFRLLQTRAAADRPLRVGLIGAGKFGTMFLAQAKGLAGLHVMAVADLSPARARDALRASGWPQARFEAPSLSAAVESGATHVTDDSMALIAADGLEVVIEATGDPAAGLGHARAACRHGKHIVMVNVEADVLAGALLAREASAAGLVYSLAYGDQPALICEQVDWARACGLTVVAAGKGTKYLPSYHDSTPETVWGHYGMSPERAAAGGMNPKMFNSFLDGTKSAIEMAAVANATGLAAPAAGLGFPPAHVDDLAEILKPRGEGGTLEAKGQVEVVSCLERDGGPIDRDLRWGTYVVFEAPGDYTARCFQEYGLVTDKSGRYSALYRPYHLIGLELPVSVLSAALRGEPTGAPEGFRADVAAVAKRDLAVGETLDGEGGACVWGRLLPAAASLAQGALPIGLAHGIAVTRPVAKGEILTTQDVDLETGSSALAIRREMETAFAPGLAAAQ
ncbi:MAG: SAF domain-containing protein [Pseudomonadota bacterium]